MTAAKARTSTAPAADPDQEFVITRVFDAPRERERQRAAPSRMPEPVASRAHLEKALACCDRLP